MKTWLLFLAGLLVVSTTLCQAKSDKPLFASSGTNPALIERIDVFVVDPSNDAANNRQCMGGAEFGALRGGGAADASLRKRGYNKDGNSRTRFYTAPITLSDAVLSNPSKEGLQDLANRKYLDSKSREMPSPGRWIMIINIDELGSRENSLKGPGRATLSMYLYDRDQGTLLWHDQATENCGEVCWATLCRRGN